MADICLGAAVNFADRSSANDNMLHRHLLDADAKEVGGIFHLDYRKATVLTNDLWRRNAGGIPRHAFLLATTIRPDQRMVEAEDDEVILLRVNEIGRLPREAELLDTRATAMRHRLTVDPDRLHSDAEILDVLTRDELQFTALDCTVLGTFFNDAVGTTKFLNWGADLDSVYAISRYFVYLPSAKALSTIASFPEVTEDDLRREQHARRVPIGVVRYASTRRRARLAQLDAAPVSVRVEDFISMKTAVFGMTRAGKSNTIKTLATAVWEHSKMAREPIGQLIFDPAGEYANANDQDDGTALANLDRIDVRTYRFGARPGDAAIPLQLNFFDVDQIGAVHEIVSTLLGDQKANYVQHFLGADLAHDSAATTNAEHERNRLISRARLLFYGMLALTDFRLPTNGRVTFNMKNALANDIGTSCGVRVHNGNQGWQTIPLDGAGRFVTELAKRHAAGEQLVVDWAEDDTTTAVLTMATSNPNRSGRKLLAQVRDAHNPDAGTHFADSIWDDLTQGRIVVVDLSRGTDRIVRLLSEKVVLHLLAQASDRFVKNEAATKIQVFVEEAHRLFDRDSFVDDVDPWVRLAKEAAKFKIGLIYATQEVTSVDDRILSNTSNWIVAHLNNRREIDKLSKFYDFEAFADSILTAEDRGFVRLKTVSGRYIVPVQIDRFGSERIALARRTAGLDA